MRPLTSNCTPSNPHFSCVQFSQTLGLRPRLTRSQSRLSPFSSRGPRPPGACEGVVGSLAVALRMRTHVGDRGNCQLNNL